MASNYDLVVIGAGPGGYVAAIRAAQLGKSVAIVEKQHVGGTCLNVGCIPSKTLLEFGSQVHQIHAANDLGITTDHLNIDYSRLFEHKNNIVHTLTGGVTQLLKKNNVELIQGEAVVKDGLTIEVNQQSLKAKDIILATGSQPFVPPIEGIEDVDYLTTDTFFNLQSLPKRLAVIGGGVIATELASSMADLGVDVTIIEVADDILLTEIEEVREYLKAHLEEQGAHIITQAQIKQVTSSAIQLETGDAVEFDQLLIATGRKPNTQVVNALNIDMDGSFIQVNAFNQTSNDHIYAIGDLVKGYQLAHTASAQGVVVAEKLAGLNPKPVNPNEITRCIYTRIEAASVGLSEQQAKDAGYDVAVTESSFQGNAKAMIKGEPQGFIKIVSDMQYNEILGAFIVGPHATDLIGEVLGVKASEGTMNELSQIIQPHPFLLEAIGEGADVLFKKAIHM
ncbi:dihydrolipoyl dehydrogenase [Staphylococcus warneri]|uniref:dihydrolipoyl dehydrogenase n=1 Tax=Staphylococcus warneri TaxID=1292 RepID=UPI000E5CD60E|nr:dihydrolipoyl dehydrogenase [Staphylococcus warneri]AXZ22577.1 dihydrolipoyl dehydrogenase [Staphylococcus warneri]